MRLAAIAAALLSGPASQVLEPGQFEPDLKASVPYFACSDQELTQAYWYRWQVYRWAAA